MAWVIFLRQIGHRPNVNNVNLGRVFTLNDDLVLEETNEAKIIGHQAMFEHMCGVVTPPGCQVDIDHIAERLSTLEPKSYIRGKFELWYFVYFISRLAQLSSAAISAEADSGATMKYKAQITENTALYILGPRLDIPPSLDEFLRANLGSPN
jgi:hypothetical protein